MKKARSFHQLTMGGDAPEGIDESILTHYMSLKGEADRIGASAKIAAKPLATK